MPPRYFFSCHPFAIIRNGFRWYPIFLRVGHRVTCAKQQLQRSLRVNDLGRRIGHSSAVVPARGQFIYVNDTAIVDDSERHIEWLKVAAHCPSASGGRVPCCAKMRLATGPLPQTWLETRGLLIHRYRVRFTRGPPARVMKMVDTGDLQ